MPFHRPDTSWRRTRGLLALSVAVCFGSACPHERVQTPVAARGPLAVQIGVAAPATGVPTVGVPELIRGLYSETLLNSDRNGRLRARLCEKWQWLNGGTILELTLRAGITFHDGSPLLAETAAESMKQTFARDPSTYRNITQIQVLDDRTIRIHLSRTEALLLEDLADVKMLKGTTVGTGPFALEAKATEQGATLRAFPAYYQGRPQVERVDVKAYPSQRSAWSAMMRGEINMLYEVNRDAAPFVEAETSVIAYPLLRSYINGLFFNVRHPVLGRRDVRQALSYAVDRDAIVRDVMGGRGERADGPVWKYHWAYSTAQQTYDYNPDLARVKLDAAGFPLRVSGAAGMPRRLQFTCLIMGDDSRFERIALVLQKQLYDVGVDMQIEAVPLRELIPRIGNGHFDALFGEFISGRSLTWLYRTWRSKPTPGGLNTGYMAADAALDRLRDTFTEADTKRAVGALQQVFHDEPPAIFVAWPQTSRAVSARIQVPYENSMDVLGRIWRSQWAGTSVKGQ